MQGNGSVADRATGLPEEILPAEIRTIVYVVMQSIGVSEYRGKYEELKTVHAAQPKGPILTFAGNDTLK